MRAVVGQTRTGFNDGCGGQGFSYVPAMKIEEEIQHCLDQRQAAYDRLKMIEQGVRYMRGVVGKPTTDVTLKSKQQDEANVRYWTRRLQILGYEDDSTEG